LQVIGCVEQSDCDAQVEALAVEGQGFQVGTLSPGAERHQMTRVDHLSGPARQPRQPGGIGTTREKDTSELAIDVFQPFETVVEGSIEKEGFDAKP
jgi:hypothetical protein